MTDDRLRDSQHQLPWQPSDLIQCGATWHWATTPIEQGGLGRDPATFGQPREEGSWHALSELVAAILEPITVKWGRPTLTYGFAASELTPLVQKRGGQIAPHLDQHAACELRKNGKPICPRLGAAVDLFVPGVGGFELAKWVASNLDFDRLYVYSDDRPIHISHGPERNRSIILVERTAGTVRPRRLTLEELSRH